MAGERASLSAAAGTTVLRARVGAVQMEVPGDFAIGVRKMGGVEGGCDGSGITEAAVDVVGPEIDAETHFEREQAEGGHQAMAAPPSLNTKIYEQRKAQQPKAKKISRHMRQTLYLRVYEPALPALRMVLLRSPSPSCV